jgi:hypothetical protein
MRVLSLGEHRLAFSQYLELVLEAVMQVEVVGRPGHETRLRESLERVRDRRPLGRHQLAEQAVRERQRQPDAVALDAPPAVGKMPQEQDKANLEPGLRRDRPEHVELEWAPAGSAGQDPDDLRERPYPVSEVAVEHRELGWAQRAPPGRPHGHLIRRRGERLEQIPRPDQLDCGPPAHPDLKREQAVEDQQAEPVARSLEPGRQVARSDCDLEDPRGGELARGDPCAHVEFISELPVGVKQIRVERDRLRSVARQLRMARPSQGSRLDNPSVFDGHDKPLCGLIDLSTQGQSMPIGSCGTPRPMLLGNPGYPTSQTLPMWW